MQIYILLTICDPISTYLFQVLEEIDDDLDQFGIMFVKIDDEKEADEYGIESLPAIGKRCQPKKAL